MSLGTIDPNGTMVAEVTASRESGADPYWYLFRLDVPAPCGYLDPRPSSVAPGFTITPGDTLDVVFTVTCASGTPWGYGRLTPVPRAPATFFRALRLIAPPAAPPRYRFRWLPS
jgi:hypothetical protein